VDGGEDCGGGAGDDTRGVNYRRYGVHGVGFGIGVLRAMESESGVVKATGGSIDEGVVAKDARPDPPFVVFEDGVEVLGGAGEGDGRGKAVEFLEDFGEDFDGEGGEGVHDGERVSCSGDWPRVGPLRYLHSNGRVP